MFRCRWQHWSVISPPLSHIMFFVSLTNECPCAFSAGCALCHWPDVRVNPYGPPTKKPYYLTTTLPRVLKLSSRHVYSQPTRCNKTCNYRLAKFMMLKVFKTKFCKCVLRQNWTRPLQLRHWNISKSRWNIDGSANSSTKNVKNTRPTACIKVQLAWV